MNTTKKFAFFALLCTLPIVMGYIMLLNDVYEYFSNLLRYIVIGVSICSFIAMATVAVSQNKTLLNADHRYATVLLFLIAIAAMWYNYFILV